MKILPCNKVEQAKIIEFYRQVFSDSEGRDEGNVIAELVTNIFTTTASEDLHGFFAKDDNGILGAILFTRLTIINMDISAFLLSPVAVLTSQQGNGVGQKLINYGIDALRKENVDLVFTYGDPDFYSKVGFQQVKESVIKAPHPLSQPIGWLVQSLKDEEITPISEALRSIQAFDNPEIW